LVQGGTNWDHTKLIAHKRHFQRVFPMSGIIYLVGLVVIVLAILSFFGLR